VWNSCWTGVWTVEVAHSRVREVISYQVVPTHREGPAPKRSRDMRQRKMCSPELCYTSAQQRMPLCSLWQRAPFVQHTPAPAFSTPHPALLQHTPAGFQSSIFNRKTHSPCPGQWPRITLPCHSLYHSQGPSHTNLRALAHTLFLPDLVFGATEVSVEMTLVHRGLL
jgi:hypothetical protein